MTFLKFQMGLDMWMMGEKYLTMIMRMNHLLVSKLINIHSAFNVFKGLVKNKD